MENVIELNTEEFGVVRVVLEPEVSARLHALQVYGHGPSVESANKMVTDAQEIERFYTTLDKTLANYFFNHSLTSHSKDV